jgi:RNA-directed DNA polymerase
VNIIRALATDLGLSEIDIVRVIRTAPVRYKVYSIPKRTGGVRIIAQPAREVKLLQRWAIKNILEALPVHDCATAYRKGKSIRDNARAHAEQSYILKVDFKNFFPSIVPQNLIDHIQHYAPEIASPENLKALAFLFFRGSINPVNLTLSIGAPSSPALSNTVLFPLDLQCAELCVRRGITYTRYADDLTFSTSEKNVLEPFLGEFKKLLESVGYPRLQLNEEKTVFASKKAMRRVTGLVLNNNGEVSLGRQRKRSISAGVHSFTLQGLKVEQINKLRGLLAFALNVEPAFVASLEAKYGKRVIDTLLRRALG